MIEAYLGGVALSLEIGQAHSWSLVMGPGSHQQIFEISAPRADEIFKRAKQQGAGKNQRLRTHARGKSAETGPLGFKIKHNSLDVLDVRGLYVASVQPGSKVWTKRLLVVDRRWLATRVAVERSYNIRRRTSEKHLLSGAVVPVQVAQRTADVTYRRSTMDGGKPWTAERVLEDVLTIIYGTGGFVFDDIPVLQDTIEGLELRDDGVDAVRRVLGFLPGIDIYAGSDGRIHVVNTLNTSEIAMATAAGAPVSGQWGLVDNSLARPVGVRGHCDRELEMRFDYSTTTSTFVPGREEPTLINVIETVDPTLTLNGKLVQQGTWLPVDDWIKAVVAQDDKPSGAPELTDTLIRRWYLTGFSSPLAIYRATEGGANVIWARRFAVLLRDWRRTFRISPAWMDKIRKVRALRVAIIGTETQTRQRSQAYFDYAEKPTSLGLMRQAHGANLAWHVFGYADDLSDAKPGPAEVRMVDEDVGIIQVIAKVPPFGLGSVIAPGTLDKIPSAAVESRGNAALSAADTSLLWNQVSLVAAWKLAVVLSIIPDSPNDLGRLHREDVTPKDAVKLLPGIHSVGETLGVPWDVFCGDRSARFAWVDANAQAIKESVWTGTPPPSHLQVNPKETRAIARAQAARIYALLIDRGMGAFRAKINAGVHPTGSLRVVTHGVQSLGPGQTLLFTHLTMPPVVAPPWIWALMPERVRKIVRGVVEL